KGEPAFGYVTSLDAPKDEVQNSLQRYLKTFGRVKTQDDVLVVNEPTINGQLYKTPLVGYAKGGTAQATAWIGLQATSKNKDSVERAAKPLEFLVKTFGVNFYRYKIQAQIDEAQRAVEAVEKQQQRTLSEQKTLNQKVVNNTNEFVQLTKALQSNRADSVLLQQKLVFNKKAQDSLVLVLDKVKKAVEFQKEKQRKVN
ncbi:MAG: hypothetical protein ACK5QK_11850, partial [Chryseotalea sp.]